MTLPNEPNLPDSESENETADGAPSLQPDLEAMLAAARPGGQPEGPTRCGLIAIVGRPNVGKSTLINTWLGEERLVAFDLPGTTRDAIHVPFERHGQKFELIDTAGLRRKGKVFEAIEKFSVVKTLQAIADATGQPLEKVADDTDRNFWMGPEEARAYGIVGTIIQSAADLK